MRGHSILSHHWLPDPSNTNVRINDFHASGSSLHPEHWPGAKAMNHTQWCDLVSIDGVLWAGNPISWAASQRVSRCHEPLTWGTWGLQHGAEELWRGKGRKRAGREVKGEKRAETLGFIVRHSNTFYSVLLLPSSAEDAEDKSMNTMDYTLMWFHSLGLQ